MDLVDIIPDVRCYWSKILCCSIPTHTSLLTDLEFFMNNEMSISHMSHSSESTLQSLYYATRYNTVLVITRPGLGS